MPAQSHEPKPTTITGTGIEPCALYINFEVFIRFTAPTLPNSCSPKTRVSRSQRCSLKMPHTL
jgi:hypothetical protein